MQSIFIITEIWAATVNKKRNAKMFLILRIFKETF